MSNTRTPASGNFFAFGVVANPRASPNLPGRVRTGAVRATKAARDNQELFIENRIQITPLD